MSCFNRWSAIFLIFSVIFSSLSAREINVPADFSTIQAAIDDANNGDIVVVSPGRYYENINFNGKAITVRSSEPDKPDIVANTIIDANGIGSVIKFVSGEDADSILDGFTVTGGYAMGPGHSAFNGAGIYCLNSGPVIKNCIIKDNKAGDAGGGMYNENSSPTLLNCIFRNNTSYSGNGINSYK
ncbi:MAG: hypothetical protein PHF37_10500, partial [Phycisphaerae bacterium]|nr:hypothetical protein [Phycisphaerae bacterium]